MTWRIILFLFLSMILGLLPGSWSFAASVSPSVLDLSAARGATREASFLLTNSDAQEHTYFFQVTSFAPRVETGQPEFLPVGDTHEGVANWIAFPQRSLQVPAHTQMSVPFTVSVPASEPSGGSYAAILVSRTPSEIVSAQGSSLEATLAVLVLFTVEGETREQAALLDVTFDQTFVSVLRGAYQFRVQNQGNVHLESEGSVRITDIFGRRVLETGLPPGRVLPRSTRAFIGEIGDMAVSGLGSTIAYQMRTFALGPMRGTVTMQNGGKDPQSLSFSFWYVPWQLLLTLGILAGVVIVVPRSLRRKGR